MIEFERASELILQRAESIGTAPCPIEAAAGFVLAEEVRARTSMAPFRNSAMDGFAVRADWLDQCNALNPVTLPYDDTVFAGNAEAANRGRPVKVMTGALVPDGLDAVVPFEHTQYTDSEVTFTGVVACGSNIRPPGEDFQQNQILMSAGQVIRPTDIGVLAAAGVQTVTVWRRPTVRIVGTGDELVPPGKELERGQTFDINTYTLSGLITPWANRVIRVGCVPDLEGALAQQLDSPERVIVTSGGVSAGERDLIVGTAESCGWETVFHKVRIKPGKPVYFAVRGDQLLFGLPGNPLSAAVTCAIFVVPALKKMAGRPDYALKFEAGRLAPGEARRSGRKVFWPGRFTETPNGVQAAYSPKRSSAAISALLNTDGLIVQSSTDGDDEPTEIHVIRWESILGR